METNNETASNASSASSASNPAREMPKKRVRPKRSSRSKPVAAAEANSSAVKEKEPLNLNSLVAEYDRLTKQRDEYKAAIARHTTALTESGKKHADIRKQLAKHFNLRLPEDVVATGKGHKKGGVKGARGGGDKFRVPADGSPSHAIRIARFIVDGAKTTKQIYDTVGVGKTLLTVKQTFFKLVNQGLITRDGDNCTLSDKGVKALNEAEGKITAILAK